MVTVGKISDRIGFNENELVYLGNKSGIPQTELDGNNGIFFDTNNINKFVEVLESDNKIKETEESFINNARFYTCSENGQTYLCFRCVNSCTFCVSCVDCDSNCNGCVSCTSCVDCVNGCDICVSCNSCTSCVNCNSCHGCDNCNGCAGYCHNCQGCVGGKGCEGCTGCTGDVGPGGCTSEQGSIEYCRWCDSGCYECVRCDGCHSECVQCVNDCISYF